MKHRADSTPVHISASRSAEARGRADEPIVRLAAEWGPPELQSNAALLADHAARLTGSHCSCWYRVPRQRGGTAAQWLTLGARIGLAAVPKRLPAEHETVQFLRECGGAVVQLSPSGPFPLLLLHDALQSAAAVAVRARSGEEGLLIVGSRAPYAYNGEAIAILEQLGTFARHASYRRTS